MLQLELTFTQKLEVGVVVAVLAIAGYLLYHNTRPVADMTITAWSESRKIGIDPKRPVSAKNPADPEKTAVVTVFACHDGRLEIFEYPADSGLKASFIFVPDLTLPKRGQTYEFYKDPMARVNAISDPFKHTFSVAAYNAVYNNRGINLLGAAGLSKDQIAAEKDLRDRMMTQIDLMDNGAQTGTYEPEMYETVLRALTTYRAQEGDPTKSATKAALARKVIDRAMEYRVHLQNEEAVFIDKYINGVIALLSDDEKTKIVDAANAVNVAKGPKGPRPPRVARTRPAPVRAPPPPPTPVAGP